MSDLQQGEEEKLNSCPFATGYPVNDDTQRVSRKSSFANMATVKSLII